MTQPDPAIRAERRKALTKMYEDWMAAEAASPASLDAKRLLRAIERTPGFGRDRDYAERLAAEYARLTEQEEQHG